MQVRQVGDLLAARRHVISQLVHNFGVLAHATSQKDAQLQTVVQAGNATVQALAGQDVALRTSVEPLAVQLPTVACLNTVVPSLITSFKVLTYTTNELAYNGGGGNPGFLYWLSWFAHNINSMLSNADVHGVAWRGLILVSCGSLNGSIVGPLLETLLGTKFGC